MAEITGRKVLAFTVGAFSVIIAVNLLLAYKAVQTFPGLEVANSYVASQDFNRAKAAQLNLGWTLDPDYDSTEQRLFLTFTGKDGLTADVASVDVLVGRATIARDDQTPELVYASGLWTAPLDLEPGNWLLRVEARDAAGTLFSQRISLSVRR
jgi:nitrogen fixation protein FixH